MGREFIDERKKDGNGFASFGDKSRKLLGKLQCSRPNFDLT